MRAWPWVCVARGNMSGAGGAGGSPTGVKGFVWRDAVAGRIGETANRRDGETADDVVGTAGGTTRRPLLVVEGGTGLLPTLRMVWLNEGLNDAALLGLLEKRADVSGGDDFGNPGGDGGTDGDGG